MYTYDRLSSEFLVLLISHWMYSSCSFGYVGLSQVSSHWYLLGFFY